MTAKPCYPRYTAGGVSLERVFIRFDRVAQNKAEKPGLFRLFRQCLAVNIFKIDKFQGVAQVMCQCRADGQVAMVQGIGNQPVILQACNGFTDG